MSEERERKKRKNLKLRTFTMVFIPTQKIVCDQGGNLTPSTRPFFPTQSKISALLLFAVNED